MSTRTSSSTESAPSSRARSTSAPRSRPPIRRPCCAAATPIVMTCASSPSNHSPAYPTSVVPPSGARWTAATYQRSGPCSSSASIAADHAPAPNSSRSSRTRVGRSSAVSGRSSATSAPTVAGRLGRRGASGGVHGPRHRRLMRRLDRRSPERPLAGRGLHDVRAAQVERLGRQRQVPRPPVEREAGQHGGLGVERGAGGRAAARPGRAPRRARRRRRPGPRRRRPAGPGGPRRARRASSTAGPGPPGRLPAGLAAGPAPTRYRAQYTSRRRASVATSTSVPGVEAEVDGGLRRERVEAAHPEHGDPRARAPGSGP